jgi:hypothetical protein
MHHMNRRPLFALVLLAILFVGGLRPATAQEATPNPADDHLDIAAMNLSSEDVPEGFGLVGENYIAAQTVAENHSLDPAHTAELMDSGLIVAYGSEYANEARDITIGAYIEQFASDEGAVAGFDILEDESLRGSPGVEYADEPLEGVGDAPGEITTYSRQASGSTPSLDGVDVTFRVDNLLAGVAIEALGGAAPAKSDAVSLSRVLERRMRIALAGEELPGIDPTLPGRLLNFSVPPLLEGYLSATDAFPAARSVELLRSYESGYGRITPLGQGDSPLPLVSNGIVAFSSEDGPLAIISAGIEVQRPYQQMERVDIAPIEGADAADGFHFVSPVGEGKEIDSFRILSVSGDHLIIIDVQAAENEDVARRLALELTEAQLACIDEGNCEVIEEVDTSP